MFFSNSISALSSLIALTNTGTKFALVNFKFSTSSLSIIIGLSPSNSNSSCALNPYLALPLGVASYLDFLKLYLIGFN